MKHDEWVNLQTRYSCGHGDKVENLRLVEEERSRQRRVRKQAFGDGIVCTINPLSLISVRRAGETEVELVWDRDSRIVELQTEADADSLMNALHDRFGRWS